MYLHKHYYAPGRSIPAGERRFLQGYNQIDAHPLYGKLKGDIYMQPKHTHGKGSMAVVDRRGDIYVNTASSATPEEWAYVLAHCLLHLAFGHFDRERMPGNGVHLNRPVWNKACDIYIAAFLEDTGFGGSVCGSPADSFTIKLTDEEKIYRHLLSIGEDGSKQEYGINGTDMDMVGLDRPVEYKPGERNEYMATFAFHLANGAREAVHYVSSDSWDIRKTSPAQMAAQWFLAHYPLLGGLASGFRVIEDYSFCQKNDIQIAAVNADAGEIYLNPAAGLSREEWKFVLAHEYLHAGLDHAGRCQGRDRFLWNVACDYVINDWLAEIRIGNTPEIGVLYDPELHGMSAEAVYDLILEKARKYKRIGTLRGYNKGDIFSGPAGFGESGKGIRLDDFFRNALREGLDYHNSQERGYIPAGLVEEIRALAAVPIPWDVDLGRLFSEWFPPLQKHRSYGRVSRRQGSTPDIPRPGYVIRDEDLEGRTFGVVIDTSGSMSPRMIGYALGAVASYAVSRDVGAIRVVFCDADAYDAGYLSPEDIAGRVEVTGRGGTELQPAVTLLETAKDFPKEAPILLISDGYIEDRLAIGRKHAYLLPKGNRLPFAAKGKVFYFDREL